MTKPAVWKDDPDCGHDVKFTYQTHYCSYIRVPRLLSLQAGQALDELLLVTAFQWYELWFLVLLTDLRAALRADPTSLEPVNLLRRGVELFKLFEQHADVTERLVVRELGLTKCVSDVDVSSASSRYRELRGLCRQLQPLLGVTGELSDEVKEYASHQVSFCARFERFQEETLRPSSGPQSYAEWLHLSALFSLQDAVKSDWAEPGIEPTGFWKPESVAPDEVMFVVVHQCFEIWFKVILDLIDRAIPLLLKGAIASANRVLRRVALIQRLLVSQIQIPATMSPADFFRFRNQMTERDGRVMTTGLSPASGTESYQFREIEIVCGLGADPTFRRFLEGADRLPIRFLTPRQAERLQQPTLADAFRHAVQARGVTRLEELFTPSNAPNPHRDLEQLADTLIDFDEFFRLWRVNHLTMVERMIGGKSGTGFLGPEYLMETAGIRMQDKNRVLEERQVRPRFFEELWAVRAKL